jgi:hypothetical protein
MRRHSKLQMVNPGIGLMSHMSERCTLSEVYVIEVWHARNGIVARGGARGRVWS